MIKSLSRLRSLKFKISTFDCISIPNQIDRKYRKISTMKKARAKATETKALDPDKPLTTRSRIRKHIAVNYEPDPVEVAEQTYSANPIPVVPVPKSKATKSRKPKPTKAELELEPDKLPNNSAEEGKEEEVSKYFKRPKWEPPNWQEVLKNIQEMRAKRNAPVDTMGCERTMEENVEPNVQRYQLLISLMLSSQTKDEVTFAAMNRLKAAGLNVQNILNMDETALGKLITPVGFWRRKASYIKQATQILRDKYDDDIPNTLADLCSLPGVGPKMAFITLNVAWNQNAGIGVDTHVHRISNRLRWSGPKETKTPEQTRTGLESWLPKELWQEVNILLVGFGQTICLPINPKCSECKNNQLCPYGKSECAGKNKSKKTSNKK